ncbi:MAG: hypothetical protein SGILL_009341 [Bacillariaceae sp.]
MHPSFLNVASDSALKFEDEWIRFIQRVSFRDFPPAMNPIRIQADANEVARLGERYWSGKRSQLPAVYGDELDYLERSMFSAELLLSEDDTDEKELAKIECDPVVDAFVPLMYHQIADSKNDASFYKVEHVSASTVEPGDRSWHEMEAASSTSSSPVQLHGKIGIHDVVIPQAGSSLGAVRAVYNLGGSRRFLKLVSKHRRKYALLGTDEERTKLAREVLRTIEECRGGCFRKMRCREVDGAAVVLKSRFEGEALDYIQNRLSNGFQDVFNICAKPAPRLLMFAGSSKRDVVYVNKAVEIQHVAKVGLLQECLTWHNQPYDWVTLRDLKENNLLHSSQSDTLSTSDSVEKIHVATESSQEEGDIIMLEENASGCPERKGDSPGTRTLSLGSAVTTVSEESSSSPDHKQFDNEVDSVHPSSDVCVAVPGQDDST